MISFDLEEDVLGLDISNLMVSQDSKLPDNYEISETGLYTWKMRMNFIKYLFLYSFILAGTAFWGGFTLTIRALFIVIYYLLVIYYTQSLILL